MLALHTFNEISKVHRWLTTADIIYDWNSYFLSEFLRGEAKLFILFTRTIYTRRLIKGCSTKHSPKPIRIDRHLKKPEGNNGWKLVIISTEMGTLVRSLITCLMSLYVKITKAQNTNLKYLSLCRNARLWITILDELSIWNNLFHKTSS